jgi:hypothetical protein
MDCPSLAPNDKLYTAGNKGLEPLVRFHVRHFSKVLH